MSSSPSFANKVPILETERLRLRAHRISDYEVSCAMWADPTVAKHTTGRPQTREEVWSRLLRYVGHWAALGYGYWVIEDRATSEFLGEIGFADYRRTIEPPIDVPEAGWALIPSAHGKGYATEALAAIVNWADQHFEFDKTACIIKPDNTASVRVAEKCGYREAATRTYHDKTVLLYERPRRR